MPRVSMLPSKHLNNYNCRFAPQSVSMLPSKHLNNSFSAIN
ncbi:MAG: hypothetical protein VSS75_013780 [Candidatus Parabeggiatoa sp.]|nr:hypothetical protein [Candidatus Parabeggiatoa sp.]